MFRIRTSTYSELLIMNYLLIISTSTNESVFFMTIGKKQFSMVKQHHILSDDIIRATLELKLYVAHCIPFC